MSPKLSKEVNPRGSFYEHGTPEEEEAKHVERIRKAMERKKMRELNRKDEGKA
jgi:tripartite-type tricarboxylate transporter receptor subunit TctC